MARIAEAEAGGDFTRAAEVKVQVEGKAHLLLVCTQFEGQDWKRWMTNGWEAVAMAAGREFDAHMETEVGRVEFLLRVAHLTAERIAEGDWARTRDDLRADVIHRAPADVVWVLLGEWQPMFAACRELVDEAIWRLGEVSTWNQFWASPLDMWRGFGKVGGPMDWAEEDKG